MCVKNSKKKTSYFEQSKENFLPLYMNHVQKTKNLTTGIINGLLNSIISKYFKLNSGWSEGQNVNYTQLTMLIKF